jgi:ABC-type dipeptide/oligopeptide/nickel transport system ATPase component
MDRALLTVSNLWVRYPTPARVIEAVRGVSFSLGREKLGIVGESGLIACHKTVTEAQALRLLGFPDATVVSAPFGVYVADDVQKIQMILIANCRDETTT